MTSQKQIPPTRRHPLRINCKLCTHFFITWETKCPYGCRKMGFKGPQLPAITVFKSSGRACLHFHPKSPPKNAPAKGGIIA